MEEIPKLTMDPVAPNTDICCNCSRLASLPLVPTVLKSVKKPSYNTFVSLVFILMLSWPNAALATTTTTSAPTTSSSTTTVTTRTHSAGCNEAVCASIVSKCTLLRSCDCEITEEGCPCCKKCFACLEYLQADCCSCVGLCPAQNVTISVVSTQKSVVSDFPEAVPQLWDALTEGEDEQERWTTLTFPVDVLKPFKAAAEAKKKKQQQQQQQTDSSDVINNQIVTIQETMDSMVTVNCTVAYLRQCMAEKKCEMSCQSMGASSYRWFQDGCCECVGHGCINYGINESRCADCSFEGEDDFPEEISDEELDRLEEEYADELETLDQPTTPESAGDTG